MAGIDVRDDEKALARMKKHGLEEKKFITIQLRTHSPSSPGVDDKRPQKLNPLHPTPENIADDTRRAKVYQDLIAMWVKETGFKVVIAPEVNKENGVQQEVHLRHPARRPSLTWRISMSLLERGRACSFYARAHTVICHEPHTPIMAAPWARR